jgi:hypothetical protein
VAPETQQPQQHWLHYSPVKAATLAKHWSPAAALHRGLRLLPVQLQHLQVLTLGINPVVVLLPEFIYGLAAVLVLVQLVAAVVAAVVRVLLLNTCSQLCQVQFQ